MSKQWQGLDVDVTDEDFNIWLDGQHHSWKYAERMGFNSVVEYWDWIYWGIELGFLTETTNNEVYIDEY